MGTASGWARRPIAAGRLASLGRTVESQGSRHPLQDRGGQEVIRDGKEHKADGQVRSVQRWQGLGEPVQHEGREVGCRKRSVPSAEAPVAIREGWRGAPRQPSPHL